MWKRFVTALLVAGALLFASAAPKAQSTVTAQILDFWRLLSVGGTFSGVVLEYQTLAISAGGYANFGDARGSAGYGIRDSAGTVEFKNSGGSWAAASGGASPTATFLVKTATGAPVNAQIMGVLGTGLTLNTTTTGVQSIFAGTSCTDMFPRSLNASGAATCAKVNLSTDVTGALDPSVFPALSGDVTNTAGSTVVTLVPTTVVADSYGSSARLTTFTVDAAGRLTAAADVAPQLDLSSTNFSSLDASNLTNIPAAALTGTIPSGAFPALTGDVSTSAGSLATTVASIGGKTVTLGGSFTTSGSNTITLTTTGNTSLTLPTSGTMVSSTVTALSSLSTVGTIGTGVWQGTAVRPQYGGTGLATLTIHSILVGEGTSNVYPLAGCTNGVPWWSLSSVDPLCATSPLLTSPGFTASTILGGTGLAAGAGTNTSLTKVVNGIADNTATPVLTVTVPNAGEAATIHVRITGSLGAGGAIGAYECSSAIEGNIVVARTSGLATVPIAATAGLTADSCVSGATTLTLSYAVSAVSGATSATQTFAVNVTIARGSGSSANHQAVLVAEVLNSVASGITIS